MNFAAALLPALQVIAALLIFVAVYLVLVLCGIICLVAAETICERYCGAGIRRTIRASIMRKLDIHSVSE